MGCGKKISLAVLAVIMLAAADLCCGGAPADAVVMLKFRLPRMISALIAGAGLSLAGLQMQSVFRNPLADPHIMGVSAGASLGAAIMTMAFPAFALAQWGGLSIALAAFLGAAAASLAVVAASSRIGSASVLLVFGVLLGFVVSALTSVLEYSASEQSLKVFYNWSAGNFAANSYADIAMMAAALAAGLLLAVSGRRGLDVIVFGESYAMSIGASPVRIRVRALLGCCIVTGAVTAFCGPIGFVGIVGPHIARWVLRSSTHRWTIPGSVLCGAAVSLLADMIVASVRFPLPVGSAMAFLGIPVIIVIMLCSRRTI